MTVAELRRGDMAHVLAISEAHTQAPVVLDVKTPFGDSELRQVALATGTHMLQADMLALVGTVSRTLDEIEPGDEIWCASLPPFSEPAFWTVARRALSNPEAFVVTDRPGGGEYLVEADDGGRFEVRVRLDLDPRVTSSDELRARAQRAGLAARHLLDPDIDSTPEAFAATVEAGAVTPRGHHAECLCDQCDEAHAARSTS